MNVNFFINGRCFKTPCKTVLNAETFTVMFNTCRHIITANISDKCYFTSIDNISLSDIKKCDFHFSRNYTNPKEFLSKLYETFVSFLNTSISVKKFPVCKNTDEVLDRILEIVTATDSETGESEETTKTVATNPIEIYNKKSEINSMYGITANSLDIYNEYNETKERLVSEQFERLTGTLYKSLFKAIGLSETRKIHFIISNNMVFFNYNGTQYKYYPSQCKILKKCDRNYRRINWKNFAEENKPEGQKQNSGRSPPFTPDIRSSTINDLK